MSADRQKIFHLPEVKYTVHYKIEKPDTVTNVFHGVFKKHGVFHAQVNLFVTSSIVPAII